MAWFEDNLAALGYWLDNAVDAARQRLRPPAGGPTLAERMTTAIEWWGQLPVRTQRVIITTLFGVFLISIAAASRMLFDKPEPPPLTAAQQQAIIQVNQIMQEQQAKAKQRAAASKSTQSATRPHSN